MVIKMTHTLLNGITNTVTNLTSTTPEDVTEDFTGPDYPVYFELNPEYADGVKMVCDIKILCLRKTARTKLVI